MHGAGRRISCGVSGEEADLELSSLKEIGPESDGLLALSQQASAGFLTDLKLLI